MERFDGEALDDLLRSHVPRPERERIRDVIEALGVIANQPTHAFRGFRRAEQEMPPLRLVRGVETPPYQEAGKSAQ